MEAEKKGERWLWVWALLHELHLDRLTGSDEHMTGHSMILMFACQRVRRPHCPLLPEENRTFCLRSVGEARSGVCLRSCKAVNGLLFKLAVEHCRLAPWSSCLLRKLKEIVRDKVMPDGHFKVLVDWIGIGRLLRLSFLNLVLEVQQMVLLFCWISAPSAPEASHWRSSLAKH